MNKIKNSPKPKSDKNNPAEKNKSAETVDKHPKPVIYKTETPQITANVVDIIDQHPRPILRSAFVRELEMSASLSAAFAVVSPCTKSAINTTGSNKDENNLVDSNGNKTYIANFRSGKIRQTGKFLNRVGNLRRSIEYRKRHVAQKCHPIQFHYFRRRFRAF